MTTARSDEERARYKPPPCPRCGATEGIIVNWISVPSADDPYAKMPGTLECTSCTERLLAEMGGTFDGPDSVEWLREQRAALDRETP